MTTGTERAIEDVAETLVVLSLPNILLVLGAVLAAAVVVLAVCLAVRRRGGGTD